ncbi:hypothetical protein CLV35_3215 [Motilibacter peucedani]|uniref:Actinobacteria/chloroflexi VLRF1 release factor domain-containing protein n=1 Tax=Motilibacter peucedani TaxID=598650 RepID=A0A420XLM0_9ACTN|nr:acVLRF1 family peptidyl-tRNA hydrolase [Motilibacter peucedani]RKS71417.1 hypothetical protein CLV35_3215 [Motilibacter peucedani]
MTTSQPFRRVEVAPERLARWLATFAERHGGVRVEPSPGLVTVLAGDGSVARVEVPSPPLAGAADADPVDRLVRHASRERRLGLLLVRRGGYAAGVVVGPRVVASKVGRRHVQGRSAAGGWSQQRFARRREGQAHEAAQAAVEAAVRVLLPEAGGLEELVTGGDRDMLAEVLADRRVAPLRPLVSARVLAVPDPRRDVLEACAAQVRAVQVDVHDVLRDAARP